MSELLSLSRALHLAQIMARELECASGYQYGAYHPASRTEVVFSRSDDGRTGLWVIVPENGEQIELPHLCALKIVLLMECIIPYDRGWQPGHKPGIDFDTLGKEALRLAKQFQVLLLSERIQHD